MTPHEQGIGRQYGLPPEWWSRITWFGIGYFIANILDNGIGWVWDV